MSSTITHATQAAPREDHGGRPSVPLWFSGVGVAFVVGAMVALEWVAPTTWSWAVPVAALGLAVLGGGVVPALPWLRSRADTTDLAVIGASYIGVVGLFRLAFVGFGTDEVLGLFLSFAGGLLLGVVGPIVYTVWGRGRSLRSLGLGRHRWRATLTLGLVFAVTQFAVTLWGYDLPAPVDWVPLLVMSITVGLFEAVYFRGFVQARLEASFGTATGVAGGAALYSLYHVGYGMGTDELWFLFALGVVYAVAYQLVGNVFVLWPLLTPLGGFFTNVEAGDIELPWASIAGFAEVLAVMVVAVWLARRHQRHHDHGAPPLPREEHTLGG